VAVTLADYCKGRSLLYKSLAMLFIKNVLLAVCIGASLGLVLAELGGYRC
jgi:hypothetical protein